MPRSTQPLAVTVELSGNVRPLERRCRRRRCHRRCCRRRSRRLFAPTIFHDFSVTAPWKPKSLTTSSLDFLRNSRHLWDEAMGPTVTDQGGVRQI